MKLKEVLESIIVSDKIPEGTMIMWQPPPIQIEVEGDKIIAVMDMGALKRAAKNAVILTGLGIDKGENNGDSEELLPGGRVGNGESRD